MPIIGWREWVKLPDLGIKAIKAKVDSGARSSSLHAMNIVEYEEDGEEWVRFETQPHQRTDQKYNIRAKVLDFRAVRSSNGKKSLRPVISTRIEILGVSWEVELTLADRSKMGFRMLLGREGFRGRLLLNAGRSYLGGKPKRNKPGKNNQRPNRRTS